MVRRALGLLLLAAFAAGPHGSSCCATDEQPAARGDRAKLSICAGGADHLTATRLKRAAAGVPCLDSHERIAVRLTASPADDLADGTLRPPAALGRLPLASRPPPAA